LVSVASVREAIETHADRYLQRIYTERELADCASAAGVDPERLAARFAAKEATLKVLRPGSKGLPLRSIELRRCAEGWVGIELGPAAAELARSHGLRDFAVSVSHDGGFATAVVVAAHDSSNCTSDPI